MTLSSSAIFSLLLVSVFALLVTAVVTFNRPHSSMAQDNSNISLSINPTGINMSNFTNANVSSAETNMTNITKIPGVVNATSGQVIPLQKIVTLKDNASDSELQGLISSVKAKGAEVLFTYNIPKGFSFRAPNDQVLNEIVSNIQQNPSVISIVSDVTVGIMPQ